MLLFPTDEQKKKKDKFTHVLLFAISLYNVVL